MRDEVGKLTEEVEMLQAKYREEKLKRQSLQTHKQKTMMLKELIDN